MSMGSVDGYCSIELMSGDGWRSVDGCGSVIVLPLCWLLWLATPVWVPRGLECF